MITINSKSTQIPMLASEKGWLAVDKPAGLTVHNDTGNDLCSLAFDYIKKKPSIFNQLYLDNDFGIHPVHRLDKNTSGVLLLAANLETFRFFSKQFESRKIQKRYTAILHGSFTLPEPDNQWETWQWPLSKETGGRKNPGGSGLKKPCKTRYRLIDSSVHYTIVEIELLTGRKHQIRRHAKLSGHPVVGDARYGSTRAVNFLKTNCGFDRLGLHAHCLTVQVPGGKGAQTIETSGIPLQMRKLFENDKIN